MTERRSFVNDFLKYSPAHLLPALAGLITIPILTRLFSPEDFGHYILVISTISVLTILTGWLAMSVVRYYPIAARDDRLESISASATAGLFVSVMTIAIVFYAILSLAKHSLGEYFYYLMLIGLVVFALTAAFEMFQSFLMARREATWYSLFSIWRTMAGFGIGIGLVAAFGFGVEGLLWGSAVSVAIALPLLWRRAIGRIPKINNISAEFVKEMAKYGTPLVAGNLAAWILSLSDRYILEIFRGSHEVGIYSASYAISEKSILLLTSLFLLASGPLSVQIWEKDDEQKARDFVSSITRYYLLLCLPAAVGLSVLAIPVTDVLVSEEYHEGFRIIPFIAFSVLLFGLQQRFQASFIFYKKTGYLMAVIVVAGLANVGLNLLFIPKYGYMAAAITTLIGYINLLVIMIISSRRYFIWGFPFKSLAKAIMASAIMGAAVYPIGNSLTSSPLLNLFSGIFAGAIIYIVMLLLLHEIQNEEVQLIRKLGDKILGRIQNGQ